MGKPSNKGMSTPLSIPSLSAVTSDYSNDDNGREKELFNDGVEPTTSNEGSLSPPITLTDAASGANSIENAAQPSTGLSNESNTDATATAPTETVSDNAG